MCDETPQKYFHAISPYEGNDTFRIPTDHVRGSEDAQNGDFSAFKDPSAEFFKSKNSWTLVLIVPVINASPAFFKHLNHHFFVCFA